ncbi:MAG: V-type ATP synthase subunit I, partial [Candidatus Scatosoma sp.]
TERTFLLEAYVPEESVETVRAALESVTGACYFEFDEPSAEDNPPTLLKNGKIVRNFESITNMYSVPNSREFDPNAVMGFFYALFMGFIIGDMGYGLIMAIGGGLIWYKNRARETGFKRLSAVFSLAGVFAVLWGALFNSLLGLPVLPFTVMPDMQSDMWSLAGINVPSVLIISMEIGVVQILAGYLCRAVQRWRRGDVFGGIFEGVVWAVFSAGVFLAIIGFVEESNLPVLQKVGGITAGVSLVIAVLTAGRGEKFFGKFTKGFGAAYGVINYASDVLSYARLYGLLLSGAVVANIISANAVRWITGGNVIAAVGGVLLMLAGHAFNLAMNLLGAYIHDARLQYVEFFGRFYEGEGELFKPLGSAQKYVYLLPPVNATAGAA